METEETLGASESWILLCYKHSLLRCIMLTATTTAATGSAPPAPHYLSCHLRLRLDRGGCACKHACLILLCVAFGRVCPDSLHTVEIGRHRAYVCSMCVGR